MPDLFLRNVPPDLHARLKALARVHRRSLTKESIELLERAVADIGEAVLRELPAPIALKRPTTMEETLRFIDDEQR